MPEGAPMDGLAHELPDDDVLSRQEQKAHPLFAGRVKVYPKSVSGQIRTIKWAVLAALLGPLPRSRSLCRCS